MARSLELVASGGSLFTPGGGAAETVGASGATGGAVGASGPQSASQSSEELLSGSLGPGVPSGNLSAEQALLQMITAMTLQN